MHVLREQAGVTVLRCYGELPLAELASVAAAAAQRPVEDERALAGFEQQDDLALENGFMREPGHPASRA
jgi:hypothetical protein